MSCLPALLGLSSKSNQIIAVPHEPRTIVYGLSSLPIRDLYPISVSSILPTYLGTLSQTRPPRPPYASPIGWRNNSPSPFILMRFAPSDYCDPGYALQRESALTAMEMGMQGSRGRGQQEGTQSHPRRPILVNVKSHLSVPGHHFK